VTIQIRIVTENGGKRGKRKHGQAKYDVIHERGKE
jgi:hypothetical protein